MIASSQQQSNCFKVIEHTFFFGLCGLSIFFMYGVLDQFFSGKTGISQSKMSLKELPSIVLCFNKPSSRMTEYEYGLDFNIRYEILDDNWKNHEILFQSEDNNSIIFDETVSLEKILTENLFQCYKITSLLTNKYMVKSTTYIKIYFNDSIITDDIASSMNVYATSEINSYGISIGESGVWYHGNAMETSIDKDMGKTVKLEAVQHNYLQCIHDSVYECIARNTAASLKGSSSQCTLISLPLYPVCKHNKTYEEKNEFYNAYKKSLDECSTMPSRCINLEYIEKEAFNWKFADKNVTFKFGYEFPSNSTTLYEEYWVYDGINAIGSVGGTLGMCVGFSFTGLISSLLNIFQRTISIINSK